MATDFYLVLGKDLKRLGTRGGGNHFFWLVNPVELVDPMLIWDDYGNEYTAEEFSRVLSSCTDGVVVKENYPSYPGGAKVDFPNGTEDEYWTHKTPVSKYRDMYKQRAMGVKD